MAIPVALLNALKEVKGFDKEAFEQVHQSGEQVISIRLNPSKPAGLFQQFSTSLLPNSNLPPATPHSPVPWCRQGYYLSARPSFTFDPLFHAGCYYVQEASSMFLEQALTQSCDLSKPLRVLDLCAAPGGKSTHIQSLLSKGSLLISNETIRSRAQILKDNIVKWGCENVVVTNSDPADFSRLENFFDIIVVDAPCSGSGLFRRDPEAIDEWSENNVRLCSRRQQRIIADCWPALKKDGVLIYATCSYSREEDEEIVDWILQHFPASYIPLTSKPEWGIVASERGFRFWPDKVKGEGFFLAVIRKNEADDPAPLKLRDRPELLSKKEIGIVVGWMNTADKALIRHQQTIYAWPEEGLAEFSFLLQQCRVIYSGIRVGDLVRGKLIPDHALAMSRVVSEKIGRIELELDQAIRYLQRKDLSLPAAAKGWQLVTYERQPLGWVNILVNRVNNYYPVELRILKD